MEKVLADRIYDLFLDSGYDIKNDCHALTRALKDMVDSGLISDSNLGSKRKAIEDHIKGKVNSLKWDWIDTYCRFFNCSADYLMGYIEQPTHEITDINKQSGLSRKAIRKLLLNKEVALVTNSLLESKNGMEYFVDAIKFTRHHKHMSNYISSHISVEDIPGTTQTDLDIFKSNLDAGNQDQKEAFAIVCFDNLLRDKEIQEYFFNQDSEKVFNQISKDIKKKSK